MGRFFNMDNKFFVFMGKICRSLHAESSLYYLLYTDCYGRSISDGFVLCDNEDGKKMKRHIYSEAFSGLLSRTLSRRLL